MPLSWNEIKSRALAFSKEWETEVSEDAEAKSFWDDFFNVFGISRRRVATFEQQVKKIDDRTGFIDLLWKGQILIEHKSRGKSLDKAYQQAKDYFPGLKESELPRYILVSDFENFRLYDLDNNTHHEFALAKLVEHVHLFGFIAGYSKRVYREGDPVNIAAAELMGRLHDKLKANGYTGHQLEVYLVRLVFLLFADDTAIWEKGIFYDYLDLHTKEDGSDLALHLSQLFEVLNTPEDQRLKNLPESLAAFPYINGKLFEEGLRTAAFDSGMRKTLLDCCGLDWGKISPAIFGSLFQSVMDEKARRNLGAHYTSEKNILKLIKPLFLDELYMEFEKVKSSKPKLLQFHDKISRLRFLDPACGCGNFLIVAYRELHLLELEVIKTLLFTHEKIRAEVAASAGVDIALLARCNVDRFYGIEYEEFPAQIAQVAMWLIDHQMNMKVSETFGGYYPRIPLTKSATIKHANALRVDWQSLIEKEGEKYDYILGNPPFYGAMWLNDEQRHDIDLVFKNLKGAGILDYVSCWYYKAGEYLKKFNSNKNIECAFVSTNSITQGEQVGILWPALQNQFDIKIHFAHRTFKWSNEARGNAAVHVVIIGFSNYDIKGKEIYSYETITSDPAVQTVSNLNAYLVPGKDVAITARKESICGMPKMIWGNQPRDGGFLLMTKDEADEIIKQDSRTEKYIRKFLGGYELTNNIFRYCFWLKEADPRDLKDIPEIYSRIQKVRESRLASKAPSTRKFASTPSLFAQISQPNSDYVALPEVSSERRVYLPMAFMSKDVIASNKVQMIPDATMYHFGVMTSMMHMTWMRYTCGRMKSDYSYSNSIVYNNFPWPEAPTDKQTAAVEAAAQAVLDARAQFPTSSLADLYDPNTMPPVLVKAH